MVFCVSCGHKLAGRYCGQCGGDSQSTADAQSEVPVLTVPAGGAKNLLTEKERFSKTSQSQKVGKFAARDASKRKGSAAGGIGVAQASGQVLENLPAAVASRASPPFTQTAAHGGKKFGKVHAGPGRPPAKTYEATDADMRGTRSITEFFGRDQHKAAEGRVPRLTGFSTSSSSAHPSTSGASAEPITSSTPASSAQPSTTASAASGVLAAAAALPAALLHAASSGLAALAATYASGSEDEGDNHAAPAIDVEAVALIAEQQRVQELRTKWTQKVLKQQKGKIFEPITLSDTLIERLETLCKDKKRKAIGVRTSFDGEDKQVVMEVYDQLNSKYSSCLVRVLHIELLLLPALLQHRMYIQTSVTASDSRSLFSWQGTTQGGRPL